MIGQFPHDPGLDRADCLLRDAVDFGQLALEEARRAYLRNQNGREFCLPLPDSRTRTAATFGVPVGHVLGMRAEEQVIRIDASRIVAAMADAQVIRDRAAMDFPCEPVREHSAPRDFDPPVSTFNDRPGPEVAAAVRLGDGIVVQSLARREFPDEGDKAGGFVVHARHDCIGVAA